MCQNRCQPNGVPRMMNCNSMVDPRIANVRAMAVSQSGIVGGRCQDVFDSQTEVIIEQPVMTAPNIINHHRRVEHIVPVITENIHRNHTHHEFVVRPEPRMSQTFDSDFTVGRPLPAQQFATMQPFNAGASQLVPVEIDVIEKFGLANQGMNNAFANQFAMPLTGMNNFSFTQPGINGFAPQNFARTPI